MLKARVIVGKVPRVGKEFCEREPRLSSVFRTQTAGSTAFVILRAAKWKKEQTRAHFNCSETDSANDLWFYKKLADNLLSYENRLPWFFFSQSLAQSISMDSLADFVRQPLFSKVRKDNSSVCIKETWWVDEGCNKFSYIYFKVNILIFEQIMVKDIFKPKMLYNKRKSLYVWLLLHEIL